MHSQMFFVGLGQTVQVCYKIVAKAIANRIKKFLLELINGKNGIYEKEELSEKI